jgi:hypothetical protein
LSAGFKPTPEALVVVTVDVPLQRSNDLGDVVRVFDLAVQFLQVRR